MCPERAETHATGFYLNREIGGKFKSKTLRSFTKSKLFEDNRFYTIVSVFSHGKFVVFKILKNITGYQENFLFVAVHLGMTGSLLLKKEEDAAPKHSVAKLNIVDLSYFESSSYNSKESFTIYFVDPRKFGKIRVFEKYQDLRTFYAPDILDIESTEFVKEFKKYAEKNPNKNIKDALLDQHGIVCGLGNYLVSEILHQVNIHPISKMKYISREMKDSEIAIICDIAKMTIARMIKVKGVSMKDFFLPNGEKGSGVNLLLVYGQEGRPCLLCKNGKIIKTKISGRSTYYCHKCAKIITPVSKTAILVVDDTKKLEIPLADSIFGDMEKLL